MNDLGALLRLLSGAGVDFIVVGSGAAGGIVARELSQAGNSVVLMEQGPRYSAGQFDHDELKQRLPAHVEPAYDGMVIDA